jgi:hypothetical protein
MKPKAALTFSDSELDLIAELLAISSVSLHEALEAGRRHWPNGPLTQHLSSLQSGSADIRARIEGR